MKTPAKKVMSTCNMIAICILGVALVLSAPRTSAQPKDSRSPSQEPPPGQGQPPKPDSPPPAQPDTLEKSPEVKVISDSETVVTPSMRFEHLTTEDGLSNNAITAILQDSRGFMWIGTQDGLNRFDGYHFTTYRHDPQNSNSLSSNYIEDILEDRDGVLWIAMQNGVNRLNPLTGNITRYQYEPENPNSLGGNEIETIFQDSGGTLWFAGRPHVGLNEIHPDTNRVIRHDLSSIMKRFFGIFMMVEDRRSSGVFWLAGGQNLMKFVSDTQQFTAHTPNDEGHFLSSLAQDADGHIWMGGEAGLYEFDPVTEQFDTYTITPSSNVNILYQDTAGTFWVGSDTQGLYRFDPHTNHFTEHYAYHPADVFSLSANNITALYEDAAGVLWIGTDTAGLNLYDPRRTQFTHYRYDPDDPEGFSAAVIQSLCGDASGQLWLNFGHHLDRFNPATETVAQQIQTENARGPGFHTMSCARKGGIWAGLHDMVFHLDTEHGDMKMYDPKAEIPPRDPRLGHVSTIFEDPNGVLWIGMMAVGLYRVDPEHGTYTAYQSDPFSPRPDDPSRSLNSGLVNVVFGDRAGHIWLGYQDNGISRYDPQTQTFTHFMPDPGKSESIPAGWIEAIYEDRSGTMWFGSRNGLIRFDAEIERFTLYTEHEGLPSAFVVGIQEDLASPDGEGGNLWLSTKNGLSRFDPQTETFRNYDVHDGLQGNEFSTQSAWQSSDGRMYFGGTNGITAFYPKQITDNLYKPPIVLTELRVDNMPVTIGENSRLQHPLWDTDHLTFQPHDYMISFEFAALNYAAPHKNRYRYMLEGSDKTWNEVDSTRRFATYTHLHAGKYVLRVQGTNNSGVWSDQEAALQITVLPPWWETIWFRGAVLVAIVSVVFSGYWRRVSTIQRQKRLLEAQVAERTKELQIEKDNAVILQQKAEVAQRTSELAQQAALEAQRTAEAAQRASEAANQAKSAFLANMSHELRSPLNAILGFAQIMAREGLKNSHTLLSDQIENLEIITRSGEHLLTLINQVLELSKIEAGRMTLDETDVDVYRLLEDMEDMFRLRAQEKNVRFLVEQSEHVPQYVRTDEVKLRQVLINLLNNAFKFTEEGSVRLKIENCRLNIEEQQGISAQSSISNLQFSISDTGPGIASEEIDGLFEAFAQTETGRQSQEGTGLGLPISRKFVQLMGGDITVKSEIGQGTTFTFGIRTKRVDQSTIDNRQSTIISKQIIGLASDHPRYRMLIVDDRPDNRKLIAALLSSFSSPNMSSPHSDFDLREATNGQEAIDIWDTWEPHLIWMDMRMPVMDGYEATKHIKSEIRNSQSEIQTVIIALTASAYEEQRAEMLSAGCDDYLRKPFRDVEIFEMLHKHLGVRFVYKEEQQETGSKEQAADQDVLTPKALAALPSELVHALKEAATFCEIEVIHQVITEIRRLNAPLADALAQLAEQFEYDEILMLVQGEEAL